MEWVRTKSDEHAVDAGCFFDQKAADRVRTFFYRFIRHSKGQWAGKPFELLPWQWENVIAPLFGWKRPDGSRRFRKAGIEIGKKNGKSALLSAIGLYMLVADNEPGAEVYCLHPSTRVLGSDFRWKPVAEFRVGDTLIAFDEYPPPGGMRKLRTATVTYNGRITLPSYRVTMEDGRTIVASEGHKWLYRSGCQNGWIETRRLLPGDCIRSMGIPWEENTSKDAGYLAGVYDGEACFHDGKERSGFRISFVQKPGVVLEKTRGLMRSFGFHVSDDREHASGTKSFELTGFPECFRFLGSIRPERLLANAAQWYEGKSPNKGCHWATVLDVEPVGNTEVCAIETSTSTLFAEGLFSHNTAAADRGQASIIYNESASMVRASPALLQRLTILDSKKLIKYPGTESVYQALSSDVPTKDGLNIHCLLFDELHTQKTWDLWNALRYGGVARKQPLLLWISTAGYDRTSLCYQQVEYARGVQSGRTIDDSFLAYICEADESDDWTKEETWKKANPSYGVTMSAEDFRADCTEAQLSPLLENAFKRLRLNLWTQQNIRWLSMADWDACRAKVTEEKLRGKPCRVGIDLASVTDVASASFLFRTRKGFAVLPYFWVPRDTLKKRERENRTKLDAWIGKFIKVTPGNVIDYDVIRADINKLAKRFDVRDICIDPWNATHLATQLISDSFKVEFVRCGFASLSAASKELEKLVLSRAIEHPGNPVLDWMVSNVTITQDAMGNIKPDKANSAEKIDGVVATILALAKEIQDPIRVSKYESEGIEFL